MMLEMHLMMRHKQETYDVPGQSFWVGRSGWRYPVRCH